MDVKVELMAGNQLRVIGYLISEKKSISWMGEWLSFR